MQSATLHIKVKLEVAKGLKNLSRKKETSVGELVRRAVLSCYQLDLLGLNQSQKQAVSAFQGRYISIVKLAEEMGMNVLDIRAWLDEHDLSQNSSNSSNSSFQESDMENA